MTLCVGILLRIDCSREEKAGKVGRWGGLMAGGWTMTRDENETRGRKGAKCKAGKHMGERANIKALCFLVNMYLQFLGPPLITLVTYYSSSGKSN